MSELPPVLLVEDDESHALLVDRVMRKARLANPLVAFQNGERALSHLMAAVTDEGDGAIPALVLLDLHVPGRSGLEILEWIRSRGELERLPVLIFSGSGESRDINRAFELGVDSYLVKPVAFDALLDAVNDLSLPWALLRRDQGPDA